MKNKVKIVDNFLNEDNFSMIKKIMFNKHFPWYYANGVTSTSNNSNGHFMFGHVFFDYETKNKITSHLYDSVIKPILEKIKNKELLRAKANCYTRNNKQIKHNYHIDNIIEHNVLIFSLNDCNGYTEFESGDKIESVENRACFFNGKLKHRSVTQTNKNLRINLNLNYKV